VFLPKAEGVYSGLITLTDSASSKPQFIELSGSATVVKISPSSLKFGAQKVGAKSAPQTVMVTNDGSATTQFSVYIGGSDEKDFSETSNCGGHEIQPGASCTVKVTFDPIKTGARSADLYVELRAGSVSPSPVALSGTGD
jgi:hypothetical protein